MIIHRAAKGPVKIKKIKLRIWNLRDEIESILAHEIKEKGVDFAKKIIAELNNELSRKEPSLSLIQGSKDAVAPSSPSTPSSADAPVDDAEAEMAKAILESQSPPPAAVDDGEAEMAKAIAEAEAAESGNAPAAAPTPPPSMPPGPSLVPGKDDGEGQVIYTRKVLLPENKIAEGKALLSEITLNEILFFCNQTFTLGTSVVVEFCIPQKFRINADVVYSRRVESTAKVIAENKMSYRIACHFTFLKRGEKTLLRQFLEEISPTAESLKSKG